MNDVDVKRWAPPGKIGGSCDTYLYKLEGRSMLPALNDGDLLLIREVSVSSLRAGDVIAFHSHDFGKTVIHRIVGFIDDVNERMVLTRGDNSSRLDEPVNPELIMGHVWAGIRNGKIIPCRRLSGIFWIHSSAVLRTVRRCLRWATRKTAPDLIPLLRKTCSCDWMKK